MDVLSVISAVANGLLGTILFNMAFVAFYIVLIVIVKNKFQRQSELRENVTGKPGKTMREMIEGTLLASLIAGFISSIVVVFVGISIDLSVFEYLFFITLLLFFINVRYICISYAGGILALTAVILGLPKTNPASLIALVAVAHLAESALIALLGSRDSIPVYVKHDGEIAGAFIIQKFWPLPLMFITATAQTVNSNIQGIEAFINAGWWPLFKPAAGMPGVLVLGLGCLIAFLGYNDMAMTRQPEQKARETAVLNLIYAAVLLAVSYFAREAPVMQAVGAVLCIAGHEAVIFYGRHKEKNGIHLFKSVKRGLKILDVLDGGYAQMAGVKRGDVILGVNGRDIQTEEGLKAALKHFPAYIWIRVRTPGGEEKVLESRQYGEGIGDLGIIAVPRELEITYNTDQFENFAIIKNIVARFRSANRPA